MHLIGTVTQIVEAALIRGRVSSCLNLFSCPCVEHELRKESHKMPQTFRPKWFECISERRI